MAHGSYDPPVSQPLEKCQLDKQIYNLDVQEFHSKKRFKKNPPPPPPFKAYQSWIRKIYVAVRNTVSAIKAPVKGKGKG